MNFTYKQPYVTWKGPSTGSAVPTWSRPLINDNSNTNTGTSFAARPIKHWRKQLVPAANTGISKNAGIGMPMDRPGGSVYLGSAGYLGSAVYLGATNDCSYCPVNLYELIPTTKDTIFDNTKASDGECVACNPETNIIKSAITLLNKNYYSDTKAYLQSLCQTYDQKLSTIRIPGNKYISHRKHYPIPPSDSPTGSQLYYTENCSKKCATENSFVRTVYKPNNQQYAQQGSVSSSSRLTRLKNNTITQNGNSFKSASGQQAANTGRYQGTSDGSYFIKTKNQDCVTTHRLGNKNTKCDFKVTPVPPPPPPPPQLGLFVAVSFDIQVMTSENGILWSLVESTIPIGEWITVTYGKDSGGNDLFVALAYASQLVMTSPDGINWTMVTTVIPYGDWTSVTYGKDSVGNGRFVAVADNGNVMWSSDGINWSSVTSPPPGEWRSVTRGEDSGGNGLFVAVAYNGEAMTSPDGINWISATSPILSGQWTSVTYGEDSGGNGHFVAVADSDQVMTSTDGSVWTSPTSTIPPGDWVSVTFGKDSYGIGRFVAVAFSGPIMWSLTGINWFYASNFPGNEWESITYGQDSYGNGLFVVIGRTGKALRSLNGISWKHSTIEASDWKSVTYKPPS